MRRLPGTRFLLSFATLLALLLIVAVGLAACGGADETTATSEATGTATDAPYRIGILTNTSGDLGFLGKYVVDSMNLEVDKINADGGINGHPIELVVEDDGYDPTKGAAGFTKLAEDPTILAITGTMATILMPSLTALAEQNEIPYVSCSPRSLNSGHRTWHGPSTARPTSS